MDLRDKVALVTGGGTGLGRTISLKLARACADVALCYTKSAAEAEATIGEVRALGRQALAIRADVASSADVERMVGEVAAAFGRIDVLVNDAGYTVFVDFKRLDDISEETWDRIMAVNVKGLWLSSRAVVPAMQQRKQGSVVNISSNMAFNGGLTMMHYVTSKAAVVGFSRVLARELGPDNIRVNTLAPGATMSEEKATESALKNYERSASTRILKRIEQPEDLVGTALYLLSDLSTFVTGQTILVNGGAVLH